MAIQLYSSANMLIMILKTFAYFISLSCEGEKKEITNPAGPGSGGWGRRDLKLICIAQLISRNYPVRNVSHSLF